MNCVLKKGMLVTLSPSVSECGLMWRQCLYFRGDRVTVTLSKGEIWIQTHVNAHTHTMSNTASNLSEARGEAWKRFSLTASKGTNTADTLVVDPQLPHLGNTKFLVFKPPCSNPNPT